jgi:hypothetical protein
MAGVEPASSAWHTDIVTAGPHPERNQQDSNLQGRKHPTGVAIRRLTVQPWFQATRAGVEPAAFWSTARCADRYTYGSGGSGGIRTPNARQRPGFTDRCDSLLSPRSHLAVRVGLEPTRPFRGGRFSRPHSTPAAILTRNSAHAGRIGSEVTRRSRRDREDHGGGEQKNRSTPDNGIALLFTPRSSVYLCALRVTSELVFRTASSTEPCETKSPLFSGTVGWNLPFNARRPQSGGPPSPTHRPSPSEPKSSE